MSLKVNLVLRSTYKLIGPDDSEDKHDYIAYFDY